MGATEFGTYLGTFTGNVGVNRLFEKEPGSRLRIELAQAMVQAAARFEEFERANPQAEGYSSTEGVAFD